MSTPIAEVPVAELKRTPSTSSISSRRSDEKKRSSKQLDEEEGEVDDVGSTMSAPDMPWKYKVRRFEGHQGADFVGR